MTLEQDAIAFLENAARNWRKLPPLTPDDLADVGRALQMERVRAPAIAERDAALAEVERSEKHRNDLADKITMQSVELGAIRTRLTATQARLDEAVGLVKQSLRTMNLARERMVAFARDNIGIRHGACPKYGEQELRQQIAPLEAFLAQQEASA